MADFLKGFLDNVVSGASNPKGNLGDFQHAARLYVDDAFRLAPKSKFLYHVTFNINPKAASIIPQLTQKHKNEINMLVKAADLPKYTVEVDVKHQYNKKRVVQKRLDYSPVNITFHDDNFGVTTAMWEAYYRYYYRDGNYAKVDGAGNPTSGGVQYETPNQYNRGNIFGGQWRGRFGFDNDSLEPFFDSIIIYQLSRKRYTAFTLVNPIISQWQHDSLDQADGVTPMQNSATIDYETVFYTRGPVTEGSAPKGFAEEHYDKTPSPLTLGGGGTESILGTGGVITGGLGVLDDIVSGNAFSSPGALLGTVLRGKNLSNNLRNLSSEGLRQEGFNILNGALGNGFKNGLGGLNNLSFPKSGGLGDLLSSATSALPSPNLGSLTSLTSSLNNVPGALDNLTTATTFMKTHLNNGGAASPDNIRASFNALSSNARSSATSSALNNLGNLFT